MQALSADAAALAAASGSDPPTIDLGSAAAVHDLADESVAVAVQAGGMADAAAVSTSAIAAVADLASGRACRKLLATSLDSMTKCLKL